MAASYCNVLVTRCQRTSLPGSTYSTSQGVCFGWLATMPLLLAALLVLVLDMGALLHGVLQAASHATDAGCTAIYD